MEGMEGFASHWPLDEEVTFLNHGSFGACPRKILDFQNALYRRLESQPVAYFMREMEDALRAAAESLASFLGADAQDLVFVPNATSGVNTVLRCLKLGPGDELLITNHGYNAVNNALDFVARASGARVVQAKLPFPLRDPEQAERVVLDSVTERTRLAVLDHVTSPTGLVLPMGTLVSSLRERGVETLVDGAHGPGMLDLDLRELDPAYYTGNCHKWLCTPKGAAFLYVRRDLQEQIRPLSISHGANSQRTDRSRFQLEFLWTGTVDPTPYLCIPTCIDFLGSLLPGGWPALRQRNRDLVLEGRRLLCDFLGITPPCPEEMIGMLAAVPLPDTSAEDQVAPPADAFNIDPLQEALYQNHRIEVPVMPWPAPPGRLLRISAQLYNDISQYEKLVQALGKELAR